jgi:hypothetical protein
MIKASSLPKSACSLPYLSGAPHGKALTLIVNPSLKKPARAKHSSLLRTFVNYGQKKFYNIGLSV